MKIIIYKKKNSENVIEDIYDRFNNIEDRFAISDDNGNIVDDAQGYGYKSYKNAQKVMWYRFGGGNKKMDTIKNNKKDFFKQHDGLEEFLNEIIEDNFKEVINKEFTKVNILKAVKENFNIDMPKEYITL